MSSRVLIGVVVVLALVVGVGGLLYAFGTPQRPNPGAAEEAAVASDPAAEPAAAPDEPAAQPQEPQAQTQAATGEAPPPDPNSPLAIEIPGCVCHSDDPKLVAEHAEYRMNQCAGCHMGGVPTGQ